MQVRPSLRLHGQRCLLRNPSRPIEQEHPRPIPCERMENIQGITKRQER